MTLFAGIAEFERSLIVDRTRSGREAAKRRGVKFGPSPTLTAAQITHARRLIETEGHPVTEAAELLGVHRSPCTASSISRTQPPTKSMLHVCSKIAEC
ncbi:recombinase family protein (plasmid) [Xanthomonas axonopodis pv. khayae]